MLNYKNPRFWVIVFSIIIASAVGISLLASSDNSNPGSPVKDGVDLSYEVNESEIANYLDYHTEGKWMYIAGLKVFDEFSSSNEGSVSLNTDENILTFGMTKATGSVTGALDGPGVYFRMDLDTNQIIDKKFSPAPNYKELGREEFSEHSEEIIQLTEERMLEIGKYFEELILKMERKEQIK